MANIRAIAKQAVKTAYTNTKDMWFDCVYVEYSSDYDPSDPEELLIEETYSFEAFEVDYDKVLIESMPHEEGTLLIGTDFDFITGKFKIDSSVFITDKDANVTRYTVRATNPVQQDVLMLARLVEGG